MADLADLLGTQVMFNGRVSFNLVTDPHSYLLTLLNGRVSFKHGKQTDLLCRLDRLNHVKWASIFCLISQVKQTSQTYMLTWRVSFALFPMFNGRVYFSLANRPLLTYSC